MNPDLPQFEEGLGGWSEITLAFDLAPYAFTVPVAIQVFGTGIRTLVTGIITSTEDQFAPDDQDNENPLRSIIYFRDADEINIVWSTTRAVIAMVALAAEDSGTSPEEGEEHGEEDHA